MRVKCPACGEPGYLTMEEAERKYDEVKMIVTTKYRLYIKHGKDGCEIGPD